MYTSSLKIVLGHVYSGLCHRCVCVTCASNADIVVSEMCAFFLGLYLMLVQPVIILYLGIISAVKVAASSCSFFWGSGVHD